jgi:hypothetical protein
MTVSAVVGVTACACSHPAPAPPPAASSPAAGAPGRLSVQGPRTDLDITSAVAHLDAAGDGTLTMSLRNGTGTPEHLAMVGMPDGGRGTLHGPQKGLGALTSAGILLAPGDTVTFGGRGPTVTLDGVHGVTADRTLPLLLEFSNAGLVHLTARVAGR